MNTQEGNKLIADFEMEYDEVLKRWKKPNSVMRFAEEHLNYHSSWDWLMPVVEKIQKLNHLISINFYSEEGFPIECKIYNWGIGDPEQENENNSAIMAVWKTVVDHIQFAHSLTNGKSNQ